MISCTGPQIFFLFPFLSGICTLHRFLSCWFCSVVSSLLDLRSMVNQCWPLPWTFGSMINGQPRLTIIVQYLDYDQWSTNFGQNTLNLHSISDQWSKNLWSMVKKSTINGQQIYDQWSSYIFGVVMTLRSDASHRSAGKKMIKSWKFAPKVSQHTFTTLSVR